MTANEIRRKRRALGLTQRQLAAYLGVSYWTLVQWEQGRRVPRMDEFSLRVAFECAGRAVAAHLPLPDWRLLAVLPGSVEGPTQANGPTGEGGGV